MNKLPKIKDTLKEYESIHGKEHTYEFIEFLINTYTGIIEQFGVSLLKNGVKSQDLEHAIFQLIVINNRNRNVYKDSNDENKQSMDELSKFLSVNVMSTIASAYQDYSQWDDAPKTLQ